MLYESTMKKGSIVFLQAVIALVGIGIMAFLLWEPHVEGRNANATPFEIYFHDPFLAYAYVASIPFFVGLYYAIKVLGYVGQNKVLSPAAVQGLRTIKHCAIAIIAFVVVSFIFMLFSDPDDRPQGIVMRLFAIFGSIVVAAAAATFERILKNALDIKSENDLTV